MELNRTLLICLGAITGLLVVPRLTNISAIVLVSLILIGYGVTKDYILALSVSAILTYILVLLNTNSKKTDLAIETFKSSRKSKSSNKSRNNVNSINKSGRKSGKKSGKKSKKLNNNKTHPRFSNNTKAQNRATQNSSNYSNEYFGDDDQVDEYQVDNKDNEHFFDNKASFKENYKSLTPSQVKGLNADTQELIKTQRSLIETLNNMGPTLKEGKNVLDTFKNYFGKDGDLGDILK